MIQWSSMQGKDMLALFKLKIEYNSAFSTDLTKKLDCKIF